MHDDRAAKGYADGDSGSEVIDPAEELTRVGNWLCELYALDMNLDGNDGGHEVMLD